MSGKLSIVMMTTEGSTTLAIFITFKGSGFCARTCPHWSYSDTALFSFKYFTQSLINCLYIKILDAKTNTPLYNENVQGTYMYLITPPSYPL